VRFHRDIDPFTRAAVSIHWNGLNRPSFKRVGHTGSLAWFATAFRTAIGLGWYRSELRFLGGPKHCLGKLVDISILHELRYRVVQRLLRCAWSRFPVDTTRDEPVVGE